MARSEGIANLILTTSILCCFGKIVLSETDNSSDEEGVNMRPIIGVVAMTITDVTLLKLKPELKGKNYIASSYVKLIEMAGGRVVPIYSGLNKTELRSIFDSVNGLLFPGGETNLKSSGYHDITKTLFNWAKEANEKNDNVPILGICRGAQALITHMTGNLEALTITDSKNYTATLKWNKDELSNSVFSNVPQNILEDSENYKLTAHLHKYSISTKTYKEMESIRKVYKVMATSIDRNNIEFISIFEGKTLPFYGVQFHPEKVLFEWTESIQIPHSSKAIRLSQNIADIFLDEVRKNTKHRFDNSIDEAKHLISKENPIHTGYIEGHSPFVQIYVY